MSQKYYSADSDSFKTMKQCLLNTYPELSRYDDFMILSILNSWIHNRQSRSKRGRAIDGRHDPRPMEIVPVEIKKSNHTVNEDNVESYES